MVNEFGKRLKQIREARNMSQDEFANLLGTSKQVISRYETSQRTPKITTVYEYAQKLGVSLEQLTGYDEYSLQPAIAIKNEVFDLIGLWTPYQARKRLPVLEACQDLSEDELIEVLNYIKYLQSKRQHSGSGEDDK